MDDPEDKIPKLPTATIDHPEVTEVEQDTGSHDDYHLRIVDKPTNQSLGGTPQ
jgi:hypothetical protein